MSNGVAGPDWFLNAIAEEPVATVVDVAGCAINVLRWGRPEHPPLVLVHGGAAHALWWGFVAPLLATTHHVLAVDLSGHGDSDRRASYSVATWADEVLAVAAALCARPPVVVGHSMGGWVTMAAAARTDRPALAGVVLLDAPISGAGEDAGEQRSGVRFSPARMYPDKETALSRFTFVPGQPTLPHVREYIARHSVTEVPGGWSWKYDPVAFRDLPHDGYERYLCRIRCRVALLLAEDRAIVDDAMAGQMRDLLGRGATIARVPGTRHHLFLDQPHAFAAALRVVVSAWGHDLTRRGSIAATDPDPAAASDTSCTE